MLLRPPHASGALGLLEIVDAASGAWLADQVLKRAPVDLVLYRTCEPGKFLLAWSGDVASVEESHGHGLAEAGDALLDELLLVGAHPALWVALGASEAVGPDPGGPPAAAGSLLSVECYTVAGTLRALDAALKAAPTVVHQLHLADGYGGKGFFHLGGALEDVEAAQDAALGAAASRVVATRVVARPDPQLPITPGEPLRLARRPSGALPVPDLVPME